MNKFVAAIILAAAASACNPDGASAPPDVMEPPVVEPPIKLPLAGTLAFGSDRDGTPHIYLANPDGTDIRRLTTRPQSEFNPAWSPDGQRVAFGGEDGTYVINRDGSNLTRIPTVGYAPSWSPDGQRLLLSTEKGFKIVAADGSVQGETLIPHDPKGFTGAFAEVVLLGWNGKWSPDGAQIAFSAVTGNDFERVFIVNIDGSNGHSFFPAEKLVWNECGPEWSPDGGRIALLSMVHGIAVLDLTSNVVTPIASPGTTCWDGNFKRVAWSPDGQMLAFSKRDPPYVSGQQSLSQTSSIEIIELQSRTTRAVIPDAYGPAWSR